MKYTKENFKELGKDLTAVATSTVATIADILRVPVSLCKDANASYMAYKAKRKAAKLEVQEADQEVVDTTDTTEATAAA